MMECEVCFESYNAEARRPKVMPCGHTVCLGCLNQLHNSQCPTCRRVFPWPPVSLPNNFTVMKFISTERRHMWCSDCRAVASARCKESHSVMNLKMALQQEAQGDHLIADEEQQLAALRLLTSPARVTLETTGDGEGGSYSATCQRHTQGDTAVRNLVLLLAKESALKEVPSASSNSTAAAAPVPPTPAAPPGTQPDLTRQLLNLSLQTLTISNMVHDLSQPNNLASTILPLDERLFEAIEVNDLSNARPNQRREEKTELLDRIRQFGVRRITKLHFRKDPAWSYELLRAAAPTVRELGVHRPPWEHLQLLHAMPKLRRLDVHGASAIDGEPELPPLAATSASGLEWLRVYDLPQDTAVSLLRAHAGSLRELWLRVGTPTEDESDEDASEDSSDWQWGNEDLASMLADCDLLALKWLVLFRKDTSHSAASCQQQRSDVEDTLGDTNVLCHHADCGSVVWERF